MGTLTALLPVIERKGSRRKKRHKLMAGSVCLQVWQKYELSTLRALVKWEDLSNAVPGEGPRSKEAMFAPPKLLWRSLLASVQGLTVAPGGVPVGQDALVLLAHHFVGE